MSNRRESRSSASATFRRYADSTLERVRTPSARRVLHGYREDVASELIPSTVYQLLRVAIRFLETVERPSKTCVESLKHLDQDGIEKALASLLCGIPPGGRRSRRAGLIRFLDYCVRRSWVSSSLVCRVGLERRRPRGPEASARASLERLIIRARRPSVRPVLRSFALWLEHERELAPVTITRQVSSARTALDFWLGSETACVGRLRRLRVTDVEDLFLRGAPQQKPASQQLLRSDVRSFLRFCEAQGWAAGVELSASVPSMRRYRLSTLPRGASPADVAALVKALPTAGLCPDRNRAIVLLLATYGIRRGQVAAVRLCDFDWRKRCVLFPAHKGGRSVQHELTPAVAEAVAAYLRVRPESAAEKVFVRARPPHLGMSPVAVSHVITSLFERAGIECTPRGPHSLRHAFAQRVLAANNSLKTVSDLLGHRAFSSVAVYAKVDEQRLREVALEWPEVLA